jgi:hypothetical protein
LGKSNFDTLTVTKEQEEENAAVVFFKFKRRKKVQDANTVMSNE